MNVAIKGLKVTSVNVRKHRTLDAVVQRHPFSVAELDRKPDSVWLQSFEYAQGEDGNISPHTFRVNGPAVNFECPEERFEEHVRFLKQLVSKANAMERDYESDRRAEVEKRRAAEKAAIAQKEEIKKMLEERARAILASC